jgi:cell division protein FtsX
MRLFRSIKRYFRDAAKSVFRNFSLSLASISCITITLIVVALSIVLSYNVEEMTKLSEKINQAMPEIQNTATLEAAEEKNAPTSAFAKMKNMVRKAVNCCIE